MCLKRVGVFFVFLSLTACTQKSNVLSSLSGNSSTASSGAPAAPGTPPQNNSGKIKWNPGHYLASYGIVGPLPAGTSVTTTWVQYELQAISGHDEIVGYRSFINWGALEPEYNKYDFTIIDDLLTYLKTQYNTPKHLVLVVLPGSFTSTSPGTAGYTIPEYITSNPQYGPSPVAGSYGWWGGNGNTNSFNAAVWRSEVNGQESVNDRWIALMKALGQKYDSDPDFEAIMFQEDAMAAGDASNNGDGTWSEPTYFANMKQVLTATLGSFPTTNVIEENSWAGTPTDTQAFEQWMILNRVVPGTADTYGETYITNNKGMPENWGLAAYFGLTVPQSTYSGPDYRSTLPSMVDVEGDDIVNFTNSPPTILYTPQDICNGVNQSYHSSHVFWTYMPSSVPAAAQWVNLEKTLSGCPLVNVSYPTGYPQ